MIEDILSKIKSLFAILFLCILIMVSLSFDSEAICLFKSDYDNDKWTEEKITYDIPDGVNPNWHPLRAVSEFLPIDVSWDADAHEVVIYSHAIARKNYLVAERRYKANRLPKDLIIVNGVTYCSPTFLKIMLSNHGFIYNNEVYYFSGENVESKLINPNKNDIFKGMVITSMYELKTKMPKDYEFIRKYLTGGIKFVTEENAAAGTKGAVAYVYPSRENPICYIIGSKKSGRTLASCIAHEAYHVHQYRSCGYNGNLEYDAKKYESHIYNTLKKLNFTK